MKYDWTDWINHTPGQELPAGLYGIFEFFGSRTNGAAPFTIEGVTTIKMRGHGSWHATHPDGAYLMLLRYKLRSASEEVESSVELETV